MKWPKWLRWSPERTSSPPLSVLDEPEVAETLAALDAAKGIQQEALISLKEAGAVEAIAMSATRSALAAVAARQNSRMQRQ